MIIDFGIENSLSLLANFSCPKNLDVEQFLTDPNKAIRLEQADIARTYLMLDNQGDIVAYFSLSTKQIDIDDPDISKAERKKLDGINKNAQTIKAFLIGQIGKNQSLSNNPIQIRHILNETYQVINKAKKLIGGRTIILECEPNARLLQLYEENGFKPIKIKNNPKRTLVTLYTVVKE